jgi:hypothetical protein
VHSDNLALYPLVISILAGPSAIVSLIIVNASFAGAIASTLTDSMPRFWR